MKNTLAAIAPMHSAPTPMEQIIDLVTDAVTSRHTQRAYGRALGGFITWYQQTGAPGLSKATVQAHISHLRAAGVPASSINQRITALRKFALEAADNGLIDESTAQAMRRVEGVRSEGQRLGNWLNQRQAQAMIDAPDITTRKGLRDRAILAVLLGCGLRRAEAATLHLRHIQQREGRWVVVDLVGKRNKTRSVPMPSWAKAAIDAWCAAAGIVDGPLFLAVRRTFAKLAHKSGSPVDQIQLSLGHTSMQTTERYLGVDQNLHSAPVTNWGYRYRLVIVGR